MNTPPIIFFDGLCGLCNTLVRVLARLDRHANVRFAPIASELGVTILEKYPELTSAQTAFLLDWDKQGAERMASKSRMLSLVSDYLSWPEKFFLLPFKLIPRAIGDWLYDFVARNRYRFFRRYDTCPIPPANIRSRFIGL